MRGHYLKNIMLKALLTLGLFCSQLSTADDRFSQVEITVTRLNETSYMFTGSGGNIGVSAGQDGILIIDDQFAPLANKIARALESIQPGAPKFIINTHYHGDHTGGNRHFGQTGTIMAHHNVYKRLASNQELPSSALPVITFDDGIRLHFNQDRLRVLHLGPGHTDGDSVVLWQDEKIVHMGDLFFKDRFPYIDLNGGGSVTGYRDNVAHILNLLKDDTQVIPGHGELASKADLLRFKHMLDDSINWMKDQKKMGLSLEQIKRAGIPDTWQGWDWQFISHQQWIDTLYQGL